MFFSLCRYWLVLILTVYSSMAYVSSGFFSLSSTANIRSMELYFYSVPCSSVTGSTLHGVSLLTNNLLTSTNNIISNHTYSLDGTSIYNIAGNLGLTQSSVGCMQMYLEGGYYDGSNYNENSYSSGCLSFDESCSGGSCVSSDSQTSSWSNPSWSSPSACQTRNVYIGQNNGGLYACTLSLSGTVITNCSRISVTNLPATADNYSIANAFYNGRAYFATTLQTIGSNHVYMCTYNPSQVSTITTPPVAVLPTCWVEPNDSNYTFVGPRAIAISAGKAYITDGPNNGTSAKVVQCNIDMATGHLTSCNALTLAGEAPSNHLFLGITVNNNILYLTDFTGNGVYSCPLSGLSCSAGANTTSNPFASPKGITIYNDYAYINNQVITPGAIASCKISSTGTLTNCQKANTLSSDDSLFSSPQVMTIYNGYAYITDFNNNQVIYCTSVSGGVVSGCHTAITSFTKPTSLGIF